MSKRPRAPSPEPVRQNRARQVAELLPAVGGAAFRKFGFVQSAVVTRWPEIVGEKLARASTPESIRFPQGKKQDGVLTLTVRGAHAAMMSHITPEIIERVNRFFGYAAVARVTIRQGDIAPRAVPRPRAEPRPVPVELGNSLRAMGDPELRAVRGALAVGVATPRLPPVR